MLLTTDQKVRGSSPLGRANVLKGLGISQCTPVKPEANSMDAYMFPGALGALLAFMAIYWITKQLWDVAVWLWRLSGSAKLVVASAAYTMITIYMIAAS